MPRKSRKKSKKIVRYRRNPRSLNIGGYASGMPHQRTVKLRYSTKVLIQSNVGTIGYHQFRASSLFDPDATGTGHQPMGYDNMGALYNHYVVTGARFTVDQLSSSAVIPNAISGIYIGDDSSVPYVDFSGFIEAKRGTWCSITQQRNPGRMSLNFSTKKFFNVTDVKDNLDRLGAPIGANPTEEAICTIWYQDLSAGTTTIPFIVTVDYTAIFSEPKDLIQS